MPGFANMFPISAESGLPNVCQLYTDLDLIWPGFAQVSAILAEYGLGPFFIWIWPTYRDYGRFLPNLGPDVDAAIRKSDAQKSTQ